MNTDIIIAHYGVDARVTALCVRCLETIQQYSSDYRVILVDNGSKDLQPILAQLDQMPHLLVRNTENLGFVRATNQGLRLSSAPEVVLMNNDTEAVAGWLDKLRGALSGPRGVVGPRTTALGSWQGRTPPGEGVRDLAPGQMLAFFCVMIRRDVLDAVGLLDECYGVGFGDDDDYSWRAQEKGYVLGLVQDLVIPHKHRTTFRTLYSEEQIAEQQWTNYGKYFERRAPKMSPAEIRAMLPRMREPVVSVLKAELERR